MKAPQLQLLIVQMTSVEDWRDNLKQFDDQLEVAQRDRTTDKPDDLILLPENAFYFRFPSSQDFHVNAEHPLIRELQQRSQAHSAPILVGALPYLEQGASQPGNAMLLVTPGHVAVVYEKTHLFDVKVAGAPPVSESRYFRAGSGPRILELKGWKIGLSICYDIRFAELYSHYAKALVDVIVAPSSFLVPTGTAHWHVLLRARAIESQCFVVAPAQGGAHVSSNGEKRETYGHSLLVTPWGDLAEEIQVGGPGWFRAILSEHDLAMFRSQIPMSEHRKKWLMQTINVPIKGVQL